jgi:hypothetical protein
LNSIIGFSLILADEMLGNEVVPEYIKYGQNIRKSGEHLLKF